MKKLLCVFLAVILVISSLCFSASAATQFSDVPSTYWAYDSIKTCVEKGWFGGYPDGTFKPGITISRAEVMTVLVNALNLSTDNEYSGLYEDVDASDWYAKYVEAGKYLFYDNVIFTGNTEFRPDARMTREDTVYTLVVATKRASETQNVDIALLEKFSDSSRIKEKLKPYMAVGIQNSLISGYADGTVAPKGSLTRAEFATLLSKALSAPQGTDNVTAPSIKLNPMPEIFTYHIQTVSGTINCDTDIGTAITANGEPLKIDKYNRFDVTMDLSSGNLVKLQILVVNVYGMAELNFEFQKEAGASAATGGYNYDEEGIFDEVEDEGGHNDTSDGDDDPDANKYDG